MYVVVALLLVLADAAPAAITWISSPSPPGSIVLVLGDGFNASSSVTVRPLSNASAVPVQIAPISGQVAANTLKFALPPTLPYDAFEVTVDGSAPYIINAAEAWWCQGDLGDKATPGGWIRVMGPSVAVPSAAVADLRTQIRSVRDFLVSPVASTDDVYASASAVLGAASQLVALRAQLDALLSFNITLRLTNVQSGSVQQLSVDPHVTTQYSAYFALPTNFPVDAAESQWYVDISNGLGDFARINMFLSPEQPSVSTVRIVNTVSAWPPTGPVFTVATTSMPTQPLPNGTYPNATSDAAIAAALQAAAAAGGGVVYFPRGYYFITQPIVVPARTVLAGAGMDVTAIVLMETNVTTAPEVWIWSNTTSDADADTFPTPSSWGLQDLSVFASAFHNIIIGVPNTTVGFLMRRVRTRVNAFASSNGVFTSTHNRWANWTLEQPGPLLALHGRIFEVTDCDLFSTYDVIQSMTTNWMCNKAVWPNNCHGAFFGVVARNRIYNGGAAHFTNQWNQVIFENNYIHGISVIAMGQSIGTAPWGGYDAHILIQDNHYRFVWGNDREVMTFDDAGGSYFGTLQSVNGTGLVTSNDCWLPQDTEWGGWGGGAVVVLNGTGAGQWRRIAVPNGNATGNRTWQVDAPFTVTPATAPAAGAAASFVEILPFRGRIIFHRNSYEDTGAFQFYGHAVSNIVADNVAARFGGFINWGQWRGWIPPPPANASGDAPALPDRLGGVMGNGMQINLQIMFEHNNVTAGAALLNYNISGAVGVSANYYNNNVYVLIPAESEGQVLPTPHNYAIVMRNNVASSNGGVWVGESTANVVLENFTIADADSCVTVDAGTSLIWQAGTQCP